MRPPRRTRIWRSLPRRAGILVLLVVYLGTVIGFPLPAVGQEGASVQPCGCSTLDQSQHRCCCCRSGPVAEPAADETAVPACCARHRATPRPSGVRWVAGVAAQKCRGTSSVWLSLGAVLAPPPIASGLPTEPPGCRVAHGDESLVLHSSAPPVPPPRPSPA